MRSEWCISILFSKQFSLARLLFSRAHIHVSIGVKNKNIDSYCYSSLGQSFEINSGIIKLNNILKE